MADLAFVAQTGAKRGTVGMRRSGHAYDPYSVQIEPICDAGTPECALTATYADPGECRRTTPRDSPLTGHAPPRILGEL